MDSFSSVVAAAGSWVGRRALSFKLFGVAALALLLLIPLAMIRSTLGERRARFDGAVAEVAGRWGKAQTITGPLLVVPYTYRAETEEWSGSGSERVRQVRVRTLAAEAFFLPKELTVAGTVETAVRKRGIYAADVYTGRMRLSGRFAAVDFEFTGLRGVEPQWDRARVCLGVSDLRGVREISLAWGGAEREVQPATKRESLGPGVEAPVTLEGADQAWPFTCELTLNGSGLLAVVPAGEKTQVTLSSPWPDPSFTGAYLPVRREVGANGFSAEWTVGSLGRAFPARWTNREGAAQPARSDLTGAALGVNFAPVMTPYRAVERAIKYGLLFVTLVFTAFFLFEVAGGLRLSALNYLLVGGSLCLFFLGLLALSEIMPFPAAYGLSAGVSAGLIGGYSWSVLRSARRAGVVVLLLAAVYGYLLLVLGMEDFALLAGTGALFALLAVLMWATRRLGRNAAAAESA